MPIPSFNISGVLPPFLPGTSPTDPGGTAPYPVDMATVANELASNADRREILLGLLAYRNDLRAIGIEVGFQWLDGSFVEDVENTRHRPPADIDVVTFAYRPATHIDNADWDSLVAANLDLFDAARAKARYLCDAYFVDLTRPPHYLVMQTAYWHGLFSHQRDTSIWKGMLQVNLEPDSPVISHFLTGGPHAP